MALTVRNTPGPQHRYDMWSMVISMWLTQHFSTRGSQVGAIDGTTTAGELDATANVEAAIAGEPFTFDFDGANASWDLSGETDLAAGEYRAYWLYSNASSVASIVAGEDASTPAAALASLPNPVANLAIIGVYVAGDASNPIDFDSDTLGAAGYGTVYDGIAPGANIGVAGGSYIEPQAVDVIRA